VKIAGREFYRIPRSDWNKHMKLMFPSLADKFANDNGPSVLFPYYPFDDRLEFPAQSPVDDAGFLIKNGIASHNVDIGARAGTEGFAARKLLLFAEDDWYGECFSVLSAHGWMTDGDLSHELLVRLQAIEGVDIRERVKDLFSFGFEDGDRTWEIYLYELAATHFTKPLSRLWYAANMLSLYYIHRDDLRLGYLWCEYHMRMRYELIALKHIEMTEKNRESGMKGGQADKRRKRYDVLDRLARHNFKAMAFASDKEMVRIAKSLAAEYDAQAPEPLFTVGHKALSSKWYDDWASHFRLLAKSSG
jgi:hypothetical protein